MTDLEKINKIFPIPDFVLKKISPDSDKALLLRLDNGAIVTMIFGMRDEHIISTVDNQEVDFEEILQKTIKFI